MFPNIKDNIIFTGEIYKHYYTYAKQENYMSGFLHLPIRLLAFRTI